MNKIDLYNNFIKACDILNKSCSEDTILSSNGVFIWKADGIICISTLAEKIEKDIFPFLYKAYDINLSLMVFISKYFTFKDIEFSNDGIVFHYTASDLISTMLEDKKAKDMIPLITHDGNKGFSNKFTYIDSDDERITDIATILSNIDKNADFDNSILCTEPELDKNHLMKNETPLVLNEGKFKIRIAKSVFQSINTSDRIRFRSTPYRNDDSVFLCTATVSKPTCQVISLFNALYT